MTSPVLQLRVPQDVVDRIDAIRGDDTRSAWLQRLIDRELAGQTATPAPAAPSLAVIADAEPSHGGICMTPGCWERNTRKYGLRQVRSAPPATQPSRDTSIGGRYRHPPHVPYAAARPDRRGDKASASGARTWCHPTTSQAEPKPASRAVGEGLRRTRAVSLIQLRHRQGTHQPGTAGRGPAAPSRAPRREPGPRQPPVPVFVPGPGRPG